MVLDGRAEPMRRIWCLYEVGRARHFRQPFQLIVDDGDLAKASERTLEEKDELMKKIAQNEKESADGSARRKAVAARSASARGSGAGQRVRLPRRLSGRHSLRESMKPLPFASIGAPP